jgi:hypothetical protein
MIARLEPPPSDMVVLPELTSVRRGEAEDWGRTRAAVHVTEVHQLMADIRGLYERPELCTPDGFIPMEKIAPELKRLLLKHRV